jgi:hypothetical protein
VLRGRGTGAIPPKSEGGSGAADGQFVYGIIKKNQLIVDDFIFAILNFSYRDSNLLIIASPLGRAVQWAWP